MGADVEGVRLLRVFAMTDTRPGREGKVGIVIQYMVDDDGPFHFEIDREAFQPFAIVRTMLDAARTLRAIRAAMG